MLMAGFVWQASLAQENKKGIYFSHSSGFYDTPFDLSLTAENPAATLNYTIDGSDPLNSDTRVTVGNNAIIQIDPEIDEIRPTTPAFIVRAVALVADTFSTEYVAGTYIFLDKVKQQSHPGYGWPIGNINEQVIDLDVDTDITEDLEYADLIDDALLDIPTFSVVTDYENLFDRNSGIYVNAQGHGKVWERFCSVELINPDGSEGFYENAGLRIRGGWSRHPNFPKHAFRLFFREEYGTDKLRFPLFDQEGVDEFDKIDLRCAQNYSWANGNGELNTFVREVFSRDTQRDMDRPYTRSRYYHLYLNGLYWGLFQTQERAEARYAASYFGGDKEDYDVVKVNTDYYQYEMEATDGNLDAWNRIWSLCTTGFYNNKEYFRLEGKNSIGKPLKGAEVLVDIDNLIDYMMIIFYTGNYDSPVTQFRGNDFPNNVYCIYNREDKSQGFKFLSHDAEHSLMYKSITAGTGLNEDRVNIGTISGDQKMEIREFKYFNPHWLHHKLTQNEEYRIRFADRAEKHLSNGGVFTEENAVKRFNNRAKEIDMAIIGESARWGDTRHHPAYTRDNAWLPELENVRQKYFPYRTDIVIKQLQRADLYSHMSTVKFVVADTLFELSEYYIENEIDISIENPNSGGIIYYTLNGDDPRQVGGYLTLGAMELNDQASLNFRNSALLNFRVLKGDNWSALRTLNLISDQDDLTNLKLTEIHYHPKDEIQGADTLKSKDLEFIEFKNIGETALNLSGIQIDSAVNFTFPPNTILAPGQFYVVASKPTVFYDYYALHANGNFKNNLSNSGEQIVVSDSKGNVLINLSYSDNDPWPDKADGDGPSLVSIHFNPTDDPANPDYWRISIYDGGTPFRDDELITNIEKENFNTGLKVYPNPARNEVNVSVNNLSQEAILDISIYNLDGKKVWSNQVLNHSKIDLLSSGADRGIKVMTIKHKGYFATSKICINP